MAELIISVSGMRGIVGENFTPAVAGEYARAFATFLKESCGRNRGDTMLKVCIGRDSRPSGAMFLSAAASGLCEGGINVIDLGIIPTPSVGIMTRHLGCAGGIVITASHNPIEYNGIKLLLSDGIAPPASSAGKIKQLYLDKKFSTPDLQSRGRISSDTSAQAVHISKVMSIIEPGSIRAKAYRVVLDSVNGAGGPIGKRLLAELGCDVTAVNNEPTGFFAHKPEPTSENLTSLCMQVKRHNADIGFSQDPDADRLAIVDESGRYIGEEYTLALAVKFILSRRKGPVAANLSTSRMIDDIAAAAGCEVIRTPVGEANVAGAMLKNKCVIGGEGNGGVIDLRVGPIRDSLVAMSLVLQFMAESGKSVGMLVNEITPYYMEKTKFSADAAQAEYIITQAKKEFAQVKTSTIDGVRFDFPDAWLHIRTSNTEPIVRIIAEAKEKSTAQKYIEAITRIRERAGD